ncbi:hypothetical protein GPECTOR_21g728 [Gonium pectorale]|uniref:Uncharacterized protein n=1 Tax=Gonium pectorale TaxID=33097 RepID=A0A150GI47_GONPE|nr:hypothetical protein GPECTOR_21g728 [Gonium pectorale]|eukprot:KXZ49502.1 hypothetical protein GPECTOR_21g728 [Gonium pectorale]
MRDQSSNSRAACRRVRTAVAPESGGGDPDTGPASPHAPPPTPPESTRSQPERIPATAARLGDLFRSIDVMGHRLALLLHGDHGEGGSAATGPLPPAAAPLLLQLSELCAVGEARCEHAARASEAQAQAAAELVGEEAELVGAEARRTDASTSSADAGPSTAAAASDDGAPSGDAGAEAEAQEAAAARRRSATLLRAAALRTRARALRRLHHCAAAALERPHDPTATLALRRQLRLCAFAAAPATPAAPAPPGSGAAPQQQAPWSPSPGVPDSANASDAPAVAVAAGLAYPQAAAAAAAQPAAQPAADVGVAAASEEEGAGGPAWPAPAGYGPEPAAIADAEPQLERHQPPAPVPTAAAEEPSATPANRHTAVGTEAIADGASPSTAPPFGIRVKYTGNAYFSGGDGGASDGCSSGAKRDEEAQGESCCDAEGWVAAWWILAATSLFMPAGLGRLVRIWSYGGICLSAIKAAKRGLSRQH